MTPRSRRGSNSRTGFTRSGGLANRSLHRLGYSSIWYGNWESNPDCRFRRPMPLSFRLFPRSQKKDNLFNKSLDFRLTPNNSSNIFRHRGNKTEHKGATDILLTPRGFPLNSRMGLTTQYLSPIIQ